MKSIRQIARLLEAAQRDRRSNFREPFKLNSGETVLCESQSEYDWWQQFCGALIDKHLKPEEFSIGDIWESVVPDGRTMRAMGQRGESVSLIEAAGPVTSYMFANITGQVLFSKMMEAYQDEDFIFTGLIPTVPTQFNGEKIPGVTRLGDQAEIVAEGQMYPYANIGEDWIETPSTVKRGNIVAVTKEAVFFDRTSMVLKQAAEVGHWMGYNRELRAIDCYIDENTTAHRYRWRGTTYATYQASTPWINSATSNALLTYTNFDTVEQLFQGLVDPNTGTPINIMPDTLVVVPALVQAARNAQQATNIALQVGGFAVTGNMLSVQSPNPLGGGPTSGAYKLVTSRMLAGRLATDTNWFLGNPRKAFAYMENWPMQTATAPPNSHDEFTRDIVAQFKASERGAYATMDPRYMAKSAA